MARKYTKKQKQYIRIAVLALVAVCLIVELIGRIPGVDFNGWNDVAVMLGFRAPSVTAEGEMEVHFIDVGNADCILVRQGDKNLLIDAGERSDDRIILEYLSDHGVERLDLVIATHPHADHIGSMAEVLEAVPVERFVMSFMPESATPTTATYLKMLQVLDEKSIEVDEAEPGKIYELGTARLQILGPLEETEEINDISVVTRLTFGNRSFLFTGDAESGVEKQLINSGYTLSADVMKLGHHGSNTSNSTAFIKRVSPQCAVITCGAGNSYGHPHKEVITRLDKLNIPVYRADLCGDIVFTTDGETLSVETEKR